MFKQLKTRIFRYSVKIIKTAMKEYDLEKAPKIQEEQVVMENIYSPDNLRKDLHFS
jgi:hypothetical protein